MIAQTGALLDKAGVHWSSSKVSRVVRGFVHQVQPNGDDFADYLATQLPVSKMQRGIVADELRKVTTYRDPVGEQAVHNVLRGRR